MTLIVEEITEEINNLVCFLEPLDSLLNSHLGSFFTEDLWNKHIPSDILSELNKSGSVINFVEVFINIIAGNCPDKFAKDHPNLLNFINKAINISIFKKEKYVKLLLELENLFTKSCLGSSNVKSQKFISAKKLHEVQVASKMTAFVSDVSHSSHIVDVGGGKGYLSCSLVLDYSFKVLGLDFSKLKTCGAIKRSEKVAKLWNGQSFRFSENAPSQEEVCNKKARKQFVQNHYKQVTTFVKPDTNAEALLKESFNEDITGITLTGLHTCGDLAPTCLKIFLSCRKIRGIINIGCCYNHISEEFINDKKEGKVDLGAEHYGFPMSIFLREKKYTLGQNTRMLACHSLNQIYSKSDFESSQTSLFYRAVFETIKIKMHPSLVKIKVGRFYKKCNSFHDYMYTAMKKLGIDPQVYNLFNCDFLAEQISLMNESTGIDLDELYECYADKKPFLTAFYLIKICLAPIVESIILLDRILYLIENGVNNVYLVPLFDLKISPRGFGIIAWKDFEKT